MTMVWGKKEDKIEDLQILKILVNTISFVISKKKYIGLK
jgi:hypothetical protein